MSDEKKEGRINVEDLPQAEQELTPEEAKEVKGGLLARALCNNEVISVKASDPPTAAREAGSGMATGRRQYEP